MKKLLLGLLCGFMLCGCSSLDQVDKYNIKDYLADDCHYEILDVDNQYMYINTFTDDYGLLHNSSNILILNHEGQLIYDYKINNDVRVLDFIVYEDAVYYFTLNQTDDKYICHLMKENQNGLISLNNWELEDPYNYPTFISTSARIFYRVDNLLYTLKLSEPVMNDDVQWLFGLEEPHRKSLGYKVLNDEGLYEIYESSNEDKAVLTHKDIGKFYLDDDYIIFESTDNYYLYAYNKKTKGIKCIYDEVIDSFEVSHDYIAISNEEEILIYSKDNFKEIQSIDKDKYSIDPIEYIHKINNDFYIASKDGYILKIKVKL